MGDLHCAVRLYGNVQQAGRPGDNLRQLLRCVELQAQGYAEAVPQGAESCPARVVAPIRVKRGRSSRMELAEGPLPMMMSMAKSPWPV